MPDNNHLSPLDLMADLKKSVSSRSLRSNSKLRRPRPSTDGSVTGKRGNSSSASVHRLHHNQGESIRSASPHEEKIPMIIEPIDEEQEVRMFLGAEESPKHRDHMLSQRHRDWRIWPIYVRESAEHDKQLTREWDENMDVLLIFAGLFSAVVTSFLVQSYQNLQPNYQQYTTNILLSQLNESYYADQVANNGYANLDPNQFQIQTTDRVVNMLWFAALTFSLSAALFAMLSKAWIREYSTELSPVAYDKARQRQFRWNGLREWKMSEFINTLPMLLHISVFLFFLGLIVFLEPLDPIIFRGISVLFIVTFLVYGILSLLPLFFADCPFKIPLIKMSRRWALFKWNKSALQLASVRAQELDAIEKRGGVVEAQAVAWLIEASEMIENSEAAEAAVETIPTLKDSKDQRDAMFKRGVLSVLYRLLLDTDRDDEDRIVSILNAIEIIWQADSRGGTDIRRKPIPNDNLHNGFFARLVDILETSKSERVLDAAIQLPKQFSSWPMAEWPIAARISIPALMSQIREGRFCKEESLIAALDAARRVLSVMLRNDTVRRVTAEDLVTCIKVVTHIFKTTTSCEVRSSAVALVEMMDDMLFKAPSGWVESQIDLFTNPTEGLLTALLPLLSAGAPTDALTRMRAREVLCNLFVHPEIGEACRNWVIQHDGIPSVVHDLEICCPISAGPYESSATDQTPLHLLDYLTDNGRFTEHADKFVNAGMLEATAKFFEKNRISCEYAVFAGLLRRLLRLVNTPHEARLRESGVLAAMRIRFPNLPPHSSKPGIKELCEQITLTRQYLSNGSLSPHQITKHQPLTPVVTRGLAPFGRNPYNRIGGAGQAQFDMMALY